MTDAPISPLRRRMIEDMTVRVHNQDGEMQRPLRHIPETEPVQRTLDR
jgi:hypothetical protein